MLRIRRWKKERNTLVQRALEGRREVYLSKQVLTAFIANVVEKKQKSIIDSTIFEFRRHNLLDKTFDFLKLRTKIKQRERLMYAVATEFREEKLRFKAQGAHAGYNLDLIQTDADLLKLRVFHVLSSCGKKRSRSMSETARSSILDERLNQVLRNKGQILLVRCFLSWRSNTRFAQTETSLNSSQQNTNSESAQSIIQLQNMNQRIAGAQLSYTNTSPDTFDPHSNRSLPKIEQLLYGKQQYNASSQHSQQKKYTPRLVQNNNYPSGSSLIDTTLNQNNSSPFLSAINSKNNQINYNNYTDTTQDEIMENATQQNNQFNNFYLANAYQQISESKQLFQQNEQQFTLRQMTPSSNQSDDNNQSIQGLSHTDLTPGMYCDTSQSAKSSVSKNQEQYCFSHPEICSPDETNLNQSGQMMPTFQGIEVDLQQVSSKQNYGLMGEIRDSLMTVSSQQSESKAFRELDEIQEQVKDWNMLQTARDDVLRQMALQYQSIRSNEQMM